MTSSKCRQCGLVNPLNAAQCKRCGDALVFNDNPTAPIGIAPEPVKQYDEQLQRQKTEKVGPPVCFICGTNDHVEIRIVKRTYTPNWVWLFLPLGLLTAGIIGLVVQVKHSFSIPICDQCTQRRSVAGVVSWLSIIICIFLMIIACAVGVELNSFLAFVGVCAVIVGIAFAAGRYDASVNPKYTQFTKKRVEIDVPGRGRVVVLDWTLPIPPPPPPPTFPDNQ
jgi:ribosomal protein L40E